MSVTTSVSKSRVLLAALFAAQLCGHVVAHEATAPKAEKSVPDPSNSTILSSVFADKVTIPREMEGQQGTIVWKGNNFPVKDTPTFRRAQPVAGDFALYLVLHTHRPRLRATGPLTETLGEYLMLEYVRPRWEFSRERNRLERLSESTTTTVRVFGAARNPKYGNDDRWPAIRFRGLITDAAGGSFPFHMPPREMASFKDESVSLADLTYFRDYHKFAAKTREESGEPRNDRVSWSKLQAHPSLGQLWRFQWSYQDMDDPAGGIETICVSEKVPVRGLVFAKDDWSSSSGMRNYEHSIQLVNFGRLSETQVRAMETAEDVLPAELEFWKQISEKHRPKAE